MPISRVNELDIYIKSVLIFTGYKWYKTKLLSSAT